jgi:hypothetical protein
MSKNIKKIALSLPSLIVAGLIAAYLLFAYFAVDPLARRILPWVAENKLASRASVEHVRFDPLRLALTVDNLRLTRTDGAPLAGFERLYVDLETSGLFRFAWRIKDIRLTAPQVALDVAPDGKLNWADLIAKLNENKEKSNTMPRVLIDHILIERGNIQYSERNRPTPFNAALEPLGLELDGLSTLPEDRGDYQIAAKLPEQGGTFKWKGDVGLNPMVSTGTVELQGIRLAKLMQIAPPQSVPVQLTAGELQTGFSYSFAMVKGAEEPKPEVILKDIAMTLDHVKGKLPLKAGSDLGLGQLSIKLPELKFSMRQSTQLQLQGMEIGLKEAALQLGNEQLFHLPQAQVSGVDFDLAANSLKVAEVLLTDGAVQANRHLDGSLDWQQLFNSPAETQAARPADTVADANTKDNKQNEKPFRFDIANVNLKHWQAAYQDMSFKQPLSLNVQDMNVGFTLSNTDGITTIKQLESQLGPFSLKSALYPQPAATMTKLSLHGGEISLKDSTVKLQAITLSGLQAQILREANKPLNWQALLEPAAAQTPAATPKQAVNNQAPTSTDWKLALDRIALEDGAVHFEDKSTGNPVSLDIQNAALELQNTSLDLTKPVPVNVQFKVKQGGEFNARGMLALAPLKGDMKINLSALSLKPFAPYINQVALLRLNDGSANVGGKLTFKSEKALSTQFQGGFNVNNLAISEENGGATFLSWKTLASDSVKLALSPNQLHMDELRIVQPVGKIIIFEDKSVNIKRIMREQSEPVSPASNTAKPADSDVGKNGFPVSVERIKVDNGDLEFADLSIKPQFGTYINTLSGVINGLSTSPDTTAQVELDGKVDEYGSASIRGSIQPFHATDFTDLKLAFRNLEMNRLTPYSGKFAGRRIDSGKMSVDLEYNIKNRQLSGKNKFVINKLKLGEHVDSPDAVNLPLDLAIALLEDSDGVIDLDLPISGSLDDPQFSYGTVIWKAVVNVLGKIVTSPFRALGHLFGISSDKLEVVVFVPGSAELAPPEQEKLKTVAMAMVKRPSLTLAIVPGYDPIADRKAIQEEAIRRDVAQEMGLKLLPSEKPGPIDLNNPKAQTAILKLAKERSPEAKNRKMLDKLKDYFNTSKPTDQAAYETMLQQLQLWVTVTDNELITLADARATAMQQFLEQAAGMNAGRLSKAAPEQVSGDGREVQLKMNLGTAK